MHYRLERDHLGMVYRAEEVVVYVKIIKLYLSQLHAWWKSLAIIVMYIIVSYHNSSMHVVSECMQ